MKSNNAFKIVKENEFQAGISHPIKYERMRHFADMRFAQTTFHAALFLQALYQNEVINQREKKTQKTGASAGESPRWQQYSRHKGEPIQIGAGQEIDKTDDVLMSLENLGWISDKWTEN